MRRLALIAVTLAAAAAGTAAIVSASAQGSSSARFDVIFDDARGLVSGQLVKVAGARAGTIQNVVVTRDFKARVEATIDSRFMPFHQNATCAIRPEGLIAENYVDCDPGTASSPSLRARGGNPPTVPVQNTTEPVSLLDLFNIFNLPTRERLQVLIDELGIGTAGRGDDFNAILRRANPALALARQAISILTRQATQLRTILDASNTILTEASGHTAALQRFLDQASALSSLTASHANSLSQSVARLPGLLAAAQPALAELDTVAVDGTPLLNQIRKAVPELNQASSDLGPFVKAATPALSKLRQALRQAIPAIRHTSPLIGTLRNYVARSGPGTKLFAQLAENLQQHGFVENFLKVPYSVAGSLSRFDATSHMLSILLVGPDNGMCGNYATTPIPACNAHYGQHAPYKPSGTSGAPAAKATSGANRRHAKPARKTRRPPRPGRAPRSAGHGSSSAHATTTTTTPSSPPVPSTPAAPVVTQAEQTLQNLVNYLLH